MSKKDERERRIKATLETPTGTRKVKARAKTVALAQDGRLATLDYGTGSVGDLVTTPAAPPPEPVTPPNAVVPARQSEHGSTGTFNYGGFITQEDYNPKLDGLRALVIYDEMRRSDAQVASTLRAIKLPIQAASWTVTPPKDGDKQDQAHADFVTECLLADDAMTATPWNYVLQHLLLMLEFGFSVLEKVWTIGEGNSFRLRRLAPRLPKTIYRWIPNPDGTLRSVIQLAPKTEINPQGQVVTKYGFWEIPAEYAVVMCNEREGDNYYGRSILRPAYQHWYYKTMSYRIDAVSQDRYGVGIPVATLGPEFDDKGDALQKIEKNLKGLRSHEKAWLIEPRGVTYRILTSDSKGMSPDIIASVEHHNVMIASNILAGFLTQGQQRHGSFGAAATIAEQFNSALKGVTSHIAGEMKAQVIKPLLDANFDMRGRKYPNLTANDMTDADTAALATILASLGPAGFITADDSLEEYLRKINGLPALPEESKRANKPSPEEMMLKMQGVAGKEPGEGEGEEPEPEPEPKPKGRGAVAMSRTFIDGHEYSRQPDEFEQRILAYKEIPERLDSARENLVHALAVIRKKQLRAMAEKIAAKDGRPETGEFTDIRHGVVGIAPYLNDMKRAVRAAQNAMFGYGTDSVVGELRKQGMPVQLAKAHEGQKIAKSALVTSADISIKKVASGWESKIMEVAYAKRKAGLQGADLVDAITGELDKAIEVGVRGEAGKRVNEAYGLGRAAAAADHEPFIGECRYSALMDPVTCRACRMTDGQVFEYGSQDYYDVLPPNPACAGKEACRCVMLYIYHPKNAKQEEAWVEE